MKFNYHKAVQALNYLARKSDEHQINSMIALKLLWAADRYHLRKYARTIVGDTYLAMGYGPVASTTYDILKNNNFLDQEIAYANAYLKQNGYSFKSVAETDQTHLSDTDIEALDFAFEKLGKYDQWQLSEFSHNYPEWKRFEGSLKSGATKVEVIVYSDFFQNPTGAAVDIFNDEQAVLEQSLEQFEETSRIDVLL